MASTQINATWTPPPDASLNWTDCDAATRWYAAKLSELQADKQGANVAIGLVTDYMSSLLPEDYTQHPTAGQLLDWYQDGRSEELLYNMTSFPRYYCGTKICQQLQWSGDPDISGIGMMISYYIAALFTTIYFVMLVLAQLRSYGQRKQGREQKPSRLFDGFTESVNTFLDSALVFAAAMLVAGTVRYASVLRNPYSHYSIYQLLASVYMSTFSIFPALALQSATGNLRGHWLRLILWLAVIVFVIAIEVMYTSVYKAHGWYDDMLENQEALELVWLARCDTAPVRRQLENAATTGHAVLGVNLIWWIYYVISSLLSAKWKARVVDSWCIARWWRASFHCIQLINGFLALAIMWVLLEFFQVYRHYIAQTAGNAYQDDLWTFGQVLALATWAPVVIDLVSIYISGPEKSQSYKLSKRFKVIAIPVQVQKQREKVEAVHEEESQDSLMPTNQVGHSDSDGIPDRTDSRV